MKLSVIIPTFNGKNRIKNCLDALLQQSVKPYEIIVVDDGSNDDTAIFVKNKYQNLITYLNQPNQGPASARNSGAKVAGGDILVFVDDDCKPLPDFLEKLTAPFKKDPHIVATKGSYLTDQRSLIARFRQIEYEERYLLMSKCKEIDFVDTYAAAIVRKEFESAGGFDETLIAAEDIDLSYRLSNLGYKLIFVPDAVVYHQHDDTLKKYLKKKYNFAFWRVVALKKNPNKAVKDSHTPQLMKVQVLLTPFILAYVLINSILFPNNFNAYILLFLLSIFTLTNKNLLKLSWKKDRATFLSVIPLSFLRGTVQFAGVTKGLFMNLRSFI